MLHTNLYMPDWILYINKLCFKELKGFFFFLPSKTEKGQSKPVEKLGLPSSHLCTKGYGSAAAEHHLACPAGLSELWERPTELDHTLALLGEYVLLGAPI